MNLTKLFKAQKKLDSHIEKEKGLEGVDLLDKKILALQVELGELTNEFRGFKFWSENQEPNAGQTCPNCEGACHYLAYAGTSEEQEKNCDVCNGDGEINPLLEEYVDCLHFILSIGNDVFVQDEGYVRWIEQEIEGMRDVPKMFIGNKNEIVHSFIRLHEIICSLQNRQLDYLKLMREFDTLGSLLGFTWEQIEQAYFEKNRINHERQQNGY